MENQEVDKDSASYFLTSMTQEEYEERYVRPLNGKVYKFNRIKYDSAWPLTITQHRSSCSFIETLSKGQHSWNRMVRKYDREVKKKTREAGENEKKIPKNAG